LFIVVSGLEATGVLEILAGFIGKISGGNLKVMIAIIIWLSAMASAIVDNIPFSATMVPVIRALAATQGVDVNTLAWALAIGTDVGGSATPIGASANVVGTSVAAKNGYVISWGTYLRTALPATIIVVTVSMLIIFARYC
jgi:Na+/H+ antiporter NhaD/arsenite permease-like protein